MEETCEGGRELQVPFHGASVSGCPSLVLDEGGRSRSPAGSLSFLPSLQIHEEVELCVQEMGAETGEGQEG